MWQDKLSCWIYLFIFAGLIYTNIYGLHTPPEQCIEECMCQPVLTDRDLSAAEKKAYRVCGTDGIIYENLCKLVCQNCENNMTLEGRYFNATEIRFAYKICNKTKETPDAWKKLFRPRTPKPTPFTGPTTTTPKPKPKKTPPPPPPPSGPTTTPAPWTCDKDQKAIIRWGEEHKQALSKKVIAPIVLAHLGECDSKSKRSAFYASDLRGNSCEERCTCSKHRKYVCGTNGQTYHSKCRMRCDACENQMVIKVASHGKCPHRQEI